MKFSHALVIGVGEGSHAKIITTVEKYKDFFTTEASMLAWADPNWEMQNV